MMLFTLCLIGAAVLIGIIGTVMNIRENRKEYIKRIYDINSYFILETLDYLIALDDSYITATESSKSQYGKLYELHYRAIKNSFYEMSQVQREFFRFKLIGRKKARFSLIIDYEKLNDLGII